MSIIRKTKLKSLVRGVLNKVGFDLVRHAGDQGVDPYRDMARFTTSPSPVLIDVGANIGQTVVRFRSVFPKGRIHSFEPGPSAFRELSQNCGDMPGVTVWNCAIGEARARQTFFENTSRDMSSFLPLGESGWGAIQNEVDVDVVPLDDFTREHGIQTIDVLKLDTQGYELKVFHGADRLLRSGSVGLVYFEVTQSDLYDGLPSLGELFEFLRARGYALVATYDPHYQKGLLGWMDVMFIHKTRHAAWIGAGQESQPAGAA